MTPSDRIKAVLLRVRELTANATPGPWRAANGKGAASVKGPECAIYINVRTVEVDDCVARWQRDANLIAESRTLLPRLAEALEIVLDSYESADLKERVERRVADLVSPGDSVEGE